MFFLRNRANGSIQTLTLFAFSPVLLKSISLLISIHLCWPEILIGLNAALSWGGTGPQEAELGSEGELI